MINIYVKLKIDENYINIRKRIKNKIYKFLK